MNQIIEQIKILENVIKADPKNFINYFHLGDAYRKIKKYDFALKNYQKSVGVPFVAVPSHSAKFPLRHPHLPRWQPHRCLRLSAQGRGEAGTAFAAVAPEPFLPGSPAAVARQSTGLAAGARSMP